MILSSSTSSVEAFLEHYGVKGMKWGVRRDLKKQARQARANFGRVGAYAIAYAQREISESEYRSMSSKPIRISEAGGTFQRVVKDQSGKLRDGMVYVTKNEQDHTNYIAMFPPEGNNANRQKFSATIKVSKAVVSPAMKERVDTFIGTMGDKIVDPKSAQVVTGREYLLGSANNNPAIKALSDREVGLKFYQQWVQGQHQNDTFNQAYTSRLQKKGYTAVLDDADTGMMSQMPIILFPKAGARITEVVPITKDDELIARANLRAPEQRNQ